MSSRAPRQDRPVVYDDVHGFSPLLRAFRRARRAKRGKGAEPAFYCDLEAELLELSEALRTYRYCPDPYRYFRLRNTKERLVSEASFRDRVVHHSLVAAQEVLFESRFIDHSYACRKGKGVHAAVRRVHRLAKHNRYALRLDVRKYFDHLDHGVLQSLLARRIDDAGILWLTDTILAHACVPSVPFSERRGIPIGNLTSQFWANVYLDPLDHLVCDSLGHGSYTRYMDDIVVLADHKRDLWNVAIEARHFLADRLRLDLRRSVTCVAPVTEGIPWLGTRIYPALIRLDRRSRARFARKLSESVQRAAVSPQAQAREVPRAASLCGHLEHVDGHRLRRAVVTRLDSRRRA